MTFFNQIGEKLQEKGDEEQANVHTVHIGIGGYNYFVVSQSVYAVFDIQGSLQEIKFFVFVNYFFSQTETVERFSPQTKNSLGIYIAAFGNGTTGRIALGDKDAAAIEQFGASLRVIVMYAAVA